MDGDNKFGELTIAEDNTSGSMKQEKLSTQGSPIGPISGVSSLSGPTHQGQFEVNPGPPLIPSGPFTPGVIPGMNPPGMNNPGMSNPGMNQGLGIVGSPPTVGSLG